MDKVSLSQTVPRCASATPEGIRMLDKPSTPVSTSEMTLEELMAYLNKKKRIRKTEKKKGNGRTV